MQRSKTLTAFPIIMLAITVASSIARLSISAQLKANPASAGQSDLSLRKKISAVKTERQWNELLDQLAVADFNAPESDDPEGREKRRAKNRRHDKRNIVIKNPDASVTLTEVLYEGKEMWALPTADSDVILVGEVQDARAYLSNDKTGVYTEFTVRVNEVVKGDSIQISQGSTITAARPGGVVRYPNGHRRLYLISGEGLPLAKGQYVLFLKATGQEQDYAIFTMYQLTSSGIIPVDDGKQFEVYRGQEKDAFLKAVRDEIVKSSQVTPIK